MYCPTCGTSNGDDVKFCRACGEDLKIIEQALSKRLSLVLAGKLDAFFDHREALLLRDSIAWFIYGIGYSFFSVQQILNGTPGGVIWGIFTCICFVMGPLDYLAYKRSLTTKPNSENRLSSSNPLHSTAGSLEATARQDLPQPSLYCPACGESSSSTSQFCRVCGQTLHLVVRAMEKQPPRLFTKLMDAYLERKNKTYERVSNERNRVMWLGGSLLVLGLFQWMFFGHVSQFLTACLVNIFNAWNFIVCRRNLDKVQLAAEVPSTPRTKELAPSNPLLPLSPLPSITENTTELLDARPKRPMEKV